MNGRLTIKMEIRILYNIPCTPSPHTQKQKFYTLICTTGLWSSLFRFSRRPHSLYPFWIFSARIPVWNRLLILPVLLLTLLVGNPASSTDFQKGLAAADRGDYAAVSDKIGLIQWGSFPSPQECKIHSAISTVHLRSFAWRWWCISAESLSGDIEFCTIFGYPS